MSDNLVTPETLSKELLRSIFDDAFMDTSLDSDGDLRVKDQISCFVFPSEKKDRIKLLSMFGFNKSATPMQRLECANNINKEYIMVTAYLGGNDTLRFEHDIYVKGGVNKKNIVLATKLFLSIPMNAVSDHGTDLIG